MVLSIHIIILVLLSCNLGHRDAVAEDIRTTQNTECPTGYDPVPGGVAPIKCREFFFKAAEQRSNMVDLLCDSPEARLFLWN